MTPQAEETMEEATECAAVYDWEMEVETRVYAMVDSSLKFVASFEVVLRGSIWEKGARLA